VVEPARRPKSLRPSVAGGDFARRSKSPVRPSVVHPKLREIGEELQGCKVARNRKHGHSENENGRSWRWKGSEFHFPLGRTATILTGELFIWGPRNSWNHTWIEENADGRPQTEQ